MKLVSFYYDVDDSNFYTKSAINLQKQCISLDMPHLILNEKFGDTWIDNVRAKPIFLLKMLNELNEDIFWLDVDCNIHKKIDFTLDVDWIFDIRNDTQPHDYVHYIKNTNENKLFLQQWISEIELRNRGSHTAFIQIHDKLSSKRIPYGYVSLGLSDIKSKTEYFTNGK